MAVDQDKKRARWRRANARKSKVQTRGYSFKKNYGITLDDYNNLYEYQQGKCAICHTNPNPDRWGIRLYVDHDHITDKVRGLLCRRCNVGLSYIEDLQFVINSQEYLRNQG